MSTDSSCLLLCFSQLKTQPSLFPIWHCTALDPPCSASFFVTQTVIFFCCFCMCGRLTQKKKEVPSLLEQPMQKSFLSIPKMTPLMCKAFKNQCIPRVCSVTAVFVLFSQASWQQAAKWMIRPHCIAFVKYFSTAGKYHHTWVRHVQDALSVHCQGSCSRFRHQNNGQHRLHCTNYQIMLLFSTSVCFQSPSWL